MIISGIVNILRQWNVNIQQFKRENIKFIADSITQSKEIWLRIQSSGGLFRTR
jgi:hypothetical protein